MTSLNSLQDGQIIGPEHHRFRLTGEPLSYPLGDIWQAEDQSTSKAFPVTLFMIHPDLTHNKAFIAAFKQQVIKAKSYQSKHLATLLGYFVHKPALLFFATEHLDGLNLQSLLNEKRTGKLTDSQIQGLLTQSAQAVDYLLQKLPAPHGALAPELFFINKQGGIKLLPLNPRELLAETESTTPAFQYPAYQAPELFHPNPLPDSADVYSLAGIAYAVFSGAAPFQFDSDEAARQTLQLKKPGKLTDPQWQALLQALAYEPDTRPETASLLIKQLFNDQLPSSDTLPEVEATDTDEQAAEPSAKIRFKLLPLGRTTRYLLTFIAGLFSGLLVSLPLLNHQNSTDGQTMAAWQQQAEQLKQHSQDQQLLIATLEQKIAQELAANTQAATPSSRDAVQLADNFQSFQDPLGEGNYGPEMISLPAGRFRMGDLNGFGDDNEKPVREISIRHPFALSRYEVTFAQYDLFANTTGRQLPEDNGWGRGNQPVINISWQDAAAYTRWLAKTSGQPYRLPSEAEWEYAARAGTDSAYWWGNELSPRRAVCDECVPDIPDQPASVGSLPPNPWGFHDMNGNVDEWVQDCYRDTLSQHPDNGTALESTGCYNRAMRGGSWFDIGRVIRSASRYRHPASAARNTWGFRVALDLPPNQ